jgi:hypothetical protein
MAVRADQVALCDLFQDRFATESTDHEHADLAAFQSSGQVVPVHCRMVKETAAVGARLAFLQVAVPAE